MKLKIALPCLLAANLLLAVPVSSFAGDIKGNVQEKVAQKVYDIKKNKINPKRELMACKKLCVKEGKCKNVTQVRNDCYAGQGSNGVQCSCKE